MNLKQKTYYIERTDLIKDYLKDIKPYDVITREEEYNLFKELVETKDPDKKIEIRNKIITSHMRFVFAIAKRYATGDILIDLVNEGNLALFKALEDYKPNSGNRFTTMAYNYVRRAIKRYLSKEGKTVRSCTNALYAGKVKEVENEFFNKYGILPTVDEIMDMLSEKYDLDVKNISDIVDATTYSIDDISNEDDDDMSDYSEYAQISASHNDYLDVVDSEDTSYKINQALKQLSEREQTIIKMASGCGYVKEYKDKEIGEQLGLTAERVRQLRKSAEQKMAVAYAQA